MQESVTSAGIRGTDSFTIAPAWSRAVVLSAGLLVLAACSPSPTPLDSPAGPGASLPRLTADDAGVVWLSWVEPAGGGHALKYARLAADGWSEAREAARGMDWFVNWADFPSVVHAGEGRLGAHWLQKREGGPYAYDVMMRISTDGGRTWSPPASPHDDGTPTEHGFVTLFPGDHGIGAVWLDGRNTGGSSADGHATAHGGHGGAMTLRTGGLDWAGQPLAELELDTMTCDCCQTGAARTAAGTVIVYRDRSADEVRDISATVLSGGRADDPVPVAIDGWHMPACPVNGPAIDAQGDRVAVAWFTAADEKPTVKLAMSVDGGRHFGEPVSIEVGPNLGRVDVTLLPDGRPVVSWLGLDGKEAVIRYRAVSADGMPGEVHSLATTSQARSSGFPQMAVSGHRLVFAWTAAGEPSRVLTTLAPLP